MEGDAAVATHAANFVPLISQQIPLQLRAPAASWRVNVEPESVLVQMYPKDALETEVSVAATRVPSEEQQSHRHRCDPAVLETPVGDQVRPL